MKMLRLKEVQAQRGRNSRSSVYAAVRDGLLTKSVPLGKRAVGWPDYEIEAICAAMIAGQTDHEVRALVVSLHELRGQRLDRIKGALNVQ